MVTHFAGPTREGRRYRRNTQSAHRNTKRNAVSPTSVRRLHAHVAINGRSLAPTVIDANGNVTSIPPNQAYSMDGTEKYVNSGWLWPSGQAPAGFPPVDNFSVKFTKAGTYNYLCEVHPWMTGQVIVK